MRYIVTQAFCQFRNIALNMALVTLFAILVFAATPAALLHAGEPPIMLENASYGKLTGHMARFIDTSNKLAIADILTPDIAARFVSLKADLNEGFVQNTVWLRFTVMRTDKFPQECWLRLEPPYLDDLSVFVQTGNDPAQTASYRRTPAGENVPMLKRPVSSSDILIPLSLPQDKAVHVYIRLQSESAVTLTGSIHTPANIIFETGREAMFQGWLLGTSTIIMLLNLFFFIRMGDKFFLFFSLFFAGNAFVTLGWNGIINLIMPVHAHLLSDSLVAFGFGFELLWLSRLLSSIFDTAKRPVFHRILIFTSVIGCLMMLSKLFRLYTFFSILTMISGSVLFIMVIWLSISAYRHKEFHNIIYAAALLLSQSGYLLQIFRVHGFIPVELWGVSPLLIAILFNIMLIAIAIMERLGMAEKKVLKINQELTANKNQLEMALASERAMGEQTHHFITMISHEYRTPLAIIRGCLDFIELKNGQQPNGDHRERQQMYHAVNRLVEIMDISLNYSRLNHTLENQQFACFQIASFMKERLAEIHALWPERRVTYSEKTDKIIICGVQQDLNTVLFNLMDNAFKYSSKDSPVMVDCRREIDQVVIRIQNQGGDFKLEEADTLFDKFVRGSNSNSAIGAGVGLWLVRRIVEKHNGQVTLERTIKNVTAVVRLPIANTDSQTAKQISQQLNCKPS